MTNTQPPTQEVREAVARAIRRREILSHSLAGMPAEVLQGAVDASWDCRLAEADDAIAAMALFSPPAGVATWRPLDDNGLAELLVNGKRITLFPSYGEAEEVAGRLNGCLGPPAGVVEALPRLRDMAEWLDDPEEVTFMLSQSVAAEHARDLRQALSALEGMGADRCPDNLVCGDVGPLPHAAPGEETFRIGQRVQVSDAYQFAADWRGQTLYVAAVQAKHRTGDITYWTSDHWPPRDHGDYTTDWNPQELIPSPGEEVPGG